MSGSARRLATEKATNDLLRAVEAAVERLAAEHPTESDQPAGDQRPGAAAADAGETNGSAPASAEPAGEGRRISVDIGPFRDFSQLVSFEDAANAIEGAGEISIRRFSEGRASIDVDLDGPVDLLRELEHRCDLEFRVRANGADEIVLDLDD